MAKQAAENIGRLEVDDWSRVKEQFEKLLKQRRREPQNGDSRGERQAAALIDDFRGFGPKQSRNLWQWLGLTRYEIPLDSRVTRWLNENHIFPFALSAQALNDENYYAFVMDGIQKVCDAAQVLPCVFDAAVFSDGENWESEELDY
ncbi:MAG: hypothetical protein ACREQI_06195 [Candidatus Binataceae bacterium]